MNHSHTCIWMHINSYMLSQNSWHKTRWVHAFMPEIKLMWLMCLCLTNELLHLPTKMDLKIHDISLFISTAVRRPPEAFDILAKEQQQLWGLEPRLNSTQGFRKILEVSVSIPRRERWKRAEKVHAEVYRVTVVCMCRSSITIWQRKTLTQLHPIKENSSCMVCHKCSPKSLQVQALCFVEILSKPASYTSRTLQDLLRVLTFPKSSLYHLFSKQKQVYKSLLSPLVNLQSCNFMMLFQNFFVFSSLFVFSYFRFFCPCKGFPGVDLVSPGGVALPRESKRPGQHARCTPGVCIVSVSRWCFRRLGIFEWKKAAFLFMIFDICRCCLNDPFLRYILKT